MQGAKAVKQKHPHAAALAIAKEIVAELTPYCQRIEIAGSLRRLKPEVADIEILYIPETAMRPVDFFSNAQVDLAQEHIEQMLTAGRITKRPNIRGQFTWGPQNKLAIHAASGIGVDFFATTVEKWWTALVIRTGSAATNMRLTTGAQKLQRTLHAYGTGVTCQGGETIAATSEQHVFKLCGVPYLPPHERTF